MFGADGSIRIDNPMPTAIIVDDSPIMRTLLRRVLVTAGFTIAAEAGTANDLLALYEQHRPDLVTLDIVMPGRDGAVAATELLGKHPDAMVVMCTSLTTREKILACQKAGVTYFLLKPFDPENAAAVFRGVLSRPRAAQVARA
jgi:two-component system chemotaxis response regulator CheY